MASLPDFAGDDGRIRAANQTIFRDVNEERHDLHTNFWEIIPVGDFVCECADPQCMARIGLTMVEYERLRSVPTHFAVRHGHVYPELERIVATYAEYTVVEKLGAAGAYAEQCDPRSLENTPE